MASENPGTTGLAGRYASALFDLAEAGKLLDTVAADLGSLAAMIGASDDLRRLIRSPVIPRADQQRALGAIMEKAGLNDLTRRFVGVVTRNRRLFVLPAMIDAYRDILAGRRGETTAQVTSAKPLSDAQLEAVRASLAKVVGAKVSIDARVDADLLGGLVVKVGSRLVDSSLSTKLSQLGLAMKGVG